MDPMAHVTEVSAIGLIAYVVHQVVPAYVRYLERAGGAMEALQVTMARIELTLAGLQGALLRLEGRVPDVEKE